MIWTAATIVIGVGVWRWADPASLQSTIMRVRRGFGVGWRSTTATLPAGLLGLLALLFALRWAAVFAHHGLTDGLRAMTGEGREADEDLCHDQQRRLHRRLTRSAARGTLDAHRGGFVPRSPRCHSTKRALTFDVRGRLTCRAHGPAEDLPAVLK